MRLAEQPEHVQWETTALLSNLEGTARTALPPNNEEEEEWGRKCVVAHLFLFLQETVKITMWAQHFQPLEHTAHHA